MSSEAAQTGRLNATLRRLRLSRAMVAEAVGVSRQTVWMWCACRTEPTRAFRTRLLEYLREFEPTVGLDDILDDEPQAAEGLVVGGNEAARAS